MNRWQWFQLVSFQVIWCAAVLGGNQWLIVPAAVILLHFTFSPSRQADLKVMCLALAGMLVDGALTLSGVFRFAEPPYWLALLWFALVLNFGHSLACLRRLRVRWLVVLGALAGTYAYLAGWKLGAVELPLGLPASALAIGLAWALLLPLLVRADLHIREGS